MSLSRLHPLWTTCGSNQYEVNKAVIVAKLLSGRYRSDWFSRHWSTTNKEGYCILCPGLSLPGDVRHILVQCKGLSEKRTSVFKYWDQQTLLYPKIRGLIDCMKAGDNLAQFVLDPSVIPEVIAGVQQAEFSLEQIFRLTRTYCYGLHRCRVKLLGQFNTN